MVSVIFGFTCIRPRHFPLRLFTEVSYLFQHYTESGPDYELPHKYIINPTGFIPNSILAKFLWSREDVAKQQEDMIYHPPSFSEEQLAEMNRKKVCIPTNNMYIPHISPFCLV